MHHQALQWGAVAAETFLYFGTGEEGGGWEKNSQQLRVGKTIKDKRKQSCNNYTEVIFTVS